MQSQHAEPQSDIVSQGQRGALGRLQGQGMQGMPGMPPKAPRPLKALEYGQNLHPAKRPSAKDILAIMDSKKNFRGVAAAFDSLKDEAAHDTMEARSSVPKPSNPYRYLLKLPKALNAIRYLATRKAWFRKKMAWELWMQLMHRLRTLDAIRNHAASRLGKWVRHSKARRALIFLQGNTEEETTLDAEGKEIKLDPMSAFAKSSVRMLRAQQATIIQCGIRRWLAGFALERQVHIKDAHVKSKLATRVQKLFRGYFCRGCFCLREKSLLLKQLRSWAQGSTQKLLARDDLSDAAHQQLILAGIYTAALPGKPLRSLPTLQQIIVLRSRLLDLQHMVENAHATLHILYKNRQEERNSMYVADLQSKYYRVVERLRLAKDQAALSAAFAERARLQEEELKLKQRKNAMSVMAHYTLDQNNQRVERENMFREEHLTRKFEQRIKQKAFNRAQQDRQGMLRQDHLSLLLRDETLQSAETKNNLAKSAEAVRLSRLKAAGVQEFDSLGNIFESILPWWAQTASVRTPEEQRVDSVKEVIHTVLGEIVFTSQADIDAEETEQEHAKIDALVPKYALTRAIPEVPGQQVFTCYPMLEEGSLKRAALLTDLRARHQDRKQMYSLLMTKKYDFLKLHADLWKIRHQLLATKFPTRKAKKACQDAATAQEILLPMARAEILRYGKALSRSFQKEVEAFVTVFVPLGADEETKKHDGVTPSTPKPPADRARARRESNASASSADEKLTGNAKEHQMSESGTNVNPDLLPNAESARSIPLVDVLEATPATATPATASTANKHARWTQHRLGAENAALEGLLPTEEQERRRSFWGFLVSESCRRGTLAGTEENDDFGTSASALAIPSPSKEGKSSHYRCTGLLPPPAFPAQKSDHDGYSISFRTSGRFDKFIPSAFRSKAGASLSETFGLDFSDSDSVSSAGTIGSRGSKTMSVAPVPGSRNTSRSSKRKQKEAKAAEENKAKARAERKPRLVPGFAFYTFEDVTEYDFIVWVQAIQNWCSAVDDWMSDFQEKWRNAHRSVLISILHRVQWLQDCNQQDLSCRNKVDGSVSDRSHSAPLSNKYDIISCNPEYQMNIYGKSTSQVAKAAAEVSRQSPLDLYELYHSRVDWHLVLSTGDESPSRVYQMKITSRQAERLFGFHSFSYTALFCLANRLSGGTVKMLNIQANTSRASVDSRWTNVASTSKAKEKSETSSGGAAAKPRRLALGLKNVVKRVTAGDNTSIPINSSTSASYLASSASQTPASPSTSARPSSAQKQKLAKKSSASDLATLAEQEIEDSKQVPSQLVGSRRDSPKAKGSPSPSAQVKLPIFVEKVGNVSVATLAALAASDSPDKRGETDGDDDSEGSPKSRIRSHSPSFSANGNKAILRTSTTPTTSDVRATISIPPTSDVRATISKLRINTTAGTSPNRPASTGKGYASPGGHAAENVTPMGASLPSTIAGKSTPDTTKTSTTGTFKQKKAERIVLDDENRAAKAEARARKNASALADQRIRVIVEPTLNVNDFIDVPSSFLSAFHERNALMRAMTEEKQQMFDLLLILLQKKLLVLSCEPKSNITNAVPPIPLPSEIAKDNVTSESSVASPYLDSLGLSHGSKTLSGKVGKERKMSMLPIDASSPVGKHAADSAGASASAGAGAGVGGGSMKLSGTNRRLNNNVRKGSSFGKFQLKNAVTGLIRNKSMAGSGTSRQSNTGGSNIGQEKKSKNAEKKTEHGVILHSTQISSAMFVTCIVNEESWEVRVSRWMRPVTHWGKPAGPEPFWRRLEIEKKSKTGGGKYTQVDKMDTRVDKIAKKILYVVKLRQRTSALAKEHLIEPMRMAVEQDCMNWEDALGIAVRRKMTQERLERRQHLASRSSKNLNKPPPQVSFYTRIKKIFSRFAKVFPASLYDPEAWHVNRLTRKPRNQKEIIHLRKLRADALIKRGESNYDTVYRHQILLVPKASNRSNLRNDNMIITPVYIALQESTSHATKFAEQRNKHYFFKRPMEFTLAASLAFEMNEWTRKTSWITGEEVNIDAKTGKHKTLTGGMVNSGSSQVHEEEGNGIKASKYTVVAKFPEAWSCGGAIDGVVTVMRVVDQQDRIPRGGPVIEVTKGEGAAALRCGFHSKLILCDDNRNAFASFTYVRVKAIDHDAKPSFSRPGTANSAPNFLQKRSLSAEAAIRQRHCYIPTSELPSSDAFYPLVLRTLYDSRHTWAVTRGFVHEIQQLALVAQLRSKRKPTLTPTLEATSPAPE